MPESLSIMVSFKLECVVLHKFVNPLPPPPPPWWTIFVYGSGGVSSKEVMKYLGIFCKFHGGLHLPLDPNLDVSGFFAHVKCFFIEILLGFIPADRDLTEINVS